MLSGDEKRWGRRRRGTREMEDWSKEIKERYVCVS